MIGFNDTRQCNKKKGANCPRCADAHGKCEDVPPGFWRRVDALLERAERVSTGEVADEATLKSGVRALLRTIRVEKRRAAVPPNTDALLGGLLVAVNRLGDIAQGILDVQHRADYLSPLVIPGADDDLDSGPDEDESVGAGPSTGAVQVALRRIST